ncbi:MAG: hypothetical protein V7K67_23790 [Nostoc sp.]
MIRKNESRRQRTRQDFNPRGTKAIIHVRIYHVERSLLKRTVTPSRSGKEIASLLVVKYQKHYPDFSPMLKACACAGEQGSRGAEESSMCQVQSPPPLCPSAPLPLCPSAFQTCEKCGTSTPDD